jgi:hypothetical protein
MTVKASAGMSKRLRLMRHLQAGFSSLRAKKRGFSPGLLFPTHQLVAFEHDGEGFCGNVDFAETFEAFFSFGLLGEHFFLA